VTVEYDRASDGWSRPARSSEHVIRPEGERVRCGPYMAPEGGGPSWGDHRVTYPGSTCEQTDCHVAHHPTQYPGWPEPMEGFLERPGVQPVAAALYGWDAAGQLQDRFGDNIAWSVAHIVIDALRDAGYAIVPADPDVEPSPR
jgi:hypothetical protein